MGRRDAPILPSLQGKAAELDEHHDRWCKALVRVDGGCMPFQPFGYHFQVDLPVRPASAKTAVRQRLKPWFEMKSGARGWIIGPFICLWLRALDRYGPMLFGTIRSQGLGTRISGRAGSDLNGIAWFGGLATLVIAMAASEIVSGARDGDSLLVLGAVLTFSSPDALDVAQGPARG
jgi:hypothetical protein